ncbi:Ig-like domain-containing protein [Clostridium beijerinckii]|uniref:Ig-like domain-containing protein n=1 Tax=Clostridium beijerinckii TaxID=1520 RepID=UPI00098C418D|nr:Ig-like domain-containing protein [Clostridium beijerinckii]MBA8935784.1 uncharacterized protein YjdB [Clostridium beijerinckii]NRU40178.1 uncharacterized protein YjdB [Clostridium beijerinckii]NSA96544.1 uncharacterized protein YjdB [Clostridium beijerinckii]OOM59882.1 bacterial Ig-like domain protein [Clostridium beijerinckii]OOM70361.1 bacterial Ig-like domain protein [Clostridium beijerinckii]
MKNYFKRFSVMLLMTLILALGICVGAFADDTGVVGTKNLNSTGENSANIGDQLIVPEIGWKRYDDTNSRINFSDGWTRADNNQTDSYRLSNSYKKPTNDLDTIKFSFYGSKIRIINYAFSAYAKGQTIIIDGIKHDFDENRTNAQGTTLSFQLLGLEKAKHNVIIVSPKADGYTGLDAVDIDEDGELLPYNESITLDKAAINITEGDYEQLTAITTPAAVEVIWKSSDPSIASIEVDPSNGKLIKVNALKEGTCTITATTADGSNLSASCTVNVNKKDIPIPNTDTKTGAILIINLTDGETKVFDVSYSEVSKFKQWYNTKSEFENKLTYEFSKTVNSNISIEEDVVHDQITSYEIRKY